MKSRIYRRTVRHALLSSMAVCGAVSIVQAQEIDRSIWQAETERRVEKQITMMSDAYELSENEVSKLRTDVEVQMNSAFEYELQMRKQLKELEMLTREPDAEEKTNGGQTILRAMTEAVDRHPLNEDKILEIAEKTIPAARAKTGRTEYQNLKQLEEARWEKWIREGAGNTPPPRVFTDENKIGVVSVGGAQVSPKGPVEDKTAVVQPPVVEKGAPPAVIPPEVMIQIPPLDEWEQYVKGVAEKYGFTESQDAKAQAILRDCRAQAAQYVKSKSSEFDRARGLADEKARKTELDRLEQPIAAKFVELKDRLENIPSTEQIRKAQEKEKAGSEKK